jgi:hypothetical protein
MQSVFGVFGYISCKKENKQVKANIEITSKVLRERPILYAQEDNFERACIKNKHYRGQHELTYHIDFYKIMVN